MYLKLKHQSIFQLKKFSHIVFFILLFLELSTSNIYAQFQGSVPLSTAPDTSDYVPDDKDFNLIVASEKGYVKEVLRLLNKKANPNARTYEGVTPLLYAIQNDNYDICQVLLLNGANPNLMAFDNIPPLIATVKNGNIDIAELLIRKEANIDAKDNNGMTALMHAAAFNDLEMCDMLLYYNASVNIQDNEGNTALLIASYYGNVEIVKLLVDNKATLEKADIKGYTPLHCASQNGNLEITKILIDNGAGTENKNSSGFTALSTAVLNNNVALTKFLLDKGADPNSKITIAMRPLNLAMNNKNDTIIRLLKEKGAHSSYSPAFNYSSIDFDFNFSNEDFILGFGYSRYDSRYGMSLNAGYSIRIKAIQVLKQTAENEYYQYWERRSFFQLGFDERIPILTWNNTNSLGIGIGGQLQYHLARYRGTTAKPERGFMLVPEAFIYSRFNGIAFSLKYQHINLSVKGNPDTRINLGIHFLIRSKQLKHASKKIL